MFDRRLLQVQSHLHHHHGLPWKDTFPSAGGLPQETAQQTYGGGGFDLPSGCGGYAQTTSYDAYSRIDQETIGSTPNVANLIDKYDTRTGQLIEQKLTAAVATNVLDDEQYKYDDPGNITKQISTRLGASTPTETQCYTYDNLDHLSAAWTATDSCAATPTAANHSTVGDSLGAASTYWTTWSFNPLGQRTQQTQHNTTDTTTTNTYNGNNTNQPHTLTGTTTTGPTTANTSYTYDTAGNMTTRAPAQGNQTLHWDDADRLTAITGSTGGDTSYQYDPEGNLLIEKAPGATTLYLPNEQITLNTTTNTDGLGRVLPIL